MVTITKDIFIKALDKAKGSTNGTTRAVIKGIGRRIRCMGMGSTSLIKGWRLKAGSRMMSMLIGLGNEFVY